MKTPIATPIYLPDERGVYLSAYGRGNAKIGLDVFTYSRLPGRLAGTCPGSTVECEAICYAKRIGGVVRERYSENSATSQVPPIPLECRLLRIHVSGDFDTVDYIDHWHARLAERSDVTAWAYTRSWRVPALLPALERLRTLPNLQLFASMDASTREAAPEGWRRAWIDGDLRGGEGDANRRTFDDTPSYVCPEERGVKADCVACGYCLQGERYDVTFLKH